MSQLEIGQLVKAHPRSTIGASALKAFYISKELLGKKELSLQAWHVNEEFTMLPETTIVDPSTNC